MSLSALQAKPVRQAAGNFIPEDLDSSALFDAIVLTQDSFLSRVEIPGLPHMPEQMFTRTDAEGCLYVENHPRDGWPGIRIELNSSDLSVRDFELSLAEDTTDGWILYTRVWFALAKAEEFSILLMGKNEGRRFGLKLEVNKAVFQLARLSRKLKLIENTFGLEFSLPSTFSSEELSNVEILFRGITEGEFTVRATDFTFSKMMPSDIDLTVPPFAGCGQITRRVADSITLFGEELPVGPIIVHLNKAESANPRVVDHVGKGSTEPIDVRFEVLDNRATYCFESYSQQSHEQRLKKLKQLKQELYHQELKEVVDLIDESLQSDVSSDEAHQIAMGWTLYNDLPDRYCPQEPQLDSDTQCWRVPIYLVYANGEGGPVGELVIDVKTGKIIKETPIEDLRRKGLALAEQILHA